MSISPRHPPASFGQSALWVAGEVSSHPAAFHLLWELHLCGSLDVAASGRALQAIVDRHQALRTSFQFEDDHLLQRVAGAVPVSCPLEDLSRLDRQAQRSQLVESGLALAEAPYDLSHDPLFRFRLVRLGEAKHVLLAAFHHLAIDGTSWPILVDEYLAHSAGRTLTPLRAQYCDFALSQRTQRAGGGWREAESYCRELFRAPLPQFELPLDHPRPAQLDASGAVFESRLSAAQAAPLRALAGAHGTSVFRVLLAAFAAFLHRLTEEREILLTTTLIGRHAPRFENLIGLFVNTGAVRVNVGTAPHFEELLAQVHSQLNAAVRCQDYPFDQAIRELKVPRDPARDPLTSVNFTKLPAAIRRQVGDLHVRDERVFLAKAQHDLTVYAQRDEESVRFVWVYRTALFDPATILNLAAQFEEMLADVAREPRRQIRDLSILPPAQRNVILGEWNATAWQFPAATGVHLLIEAQAARTPARTALISGSTRLSYTHLNFAANRLARILSQRGIGKGMFVPLLLERGPELVVAELAVMKAGAAFVPLDPAWPAERLRSILAQLGAPVVLVSAATAETVHAFGQKTLPVPDADDTGTAENLALATDATDPIYAIFTSGSTGHPKAAVNQHRGILNRFFAMTARFGSPAHDVILATTPPQFDSSVWQYFWPLTAGGCCVIASAADAIQPEALLALAAREEITFTDFVPSVLHVLVDHLTAHPAARSGLAALRRVLVGGEAMAAAPVQRFRALYPHAVVTNLYGPTETSIGVIFHEVSDSEKSSVPIGRPFPNVRAVILDPAGQLQPIGIPGELCLGGVCVGLGYLGDSEATARAFVANPFPELDCPTLYRTGDRARFRPDGVIEFLGRIDRQLKIRGLRIEPGEIEACLRLYRGIEDAAVVAQMAGDAAESLVAFVVARNGLDTLELRRFLRTRLPEALVPAAIVPLDRLPLNASGKLDRAALPLPVGPATSSLRVRARTATERRLANIWSEILGGADPSVLDDFFTSGGHSLLAVRLIAKIRREFAADVPLRTIFEHPTIETLALSLEARPGKSAGKPAFVVLREGCGDPALVMVGAGSWDVRLAQLLQPDQIVLGLEFPWPAVWHRAAALNQKSALPRLEEMSAGFVAALRPHLSGQPLVLGGFSFNGVLAFEVAHQIRRLGARVEGVILIDSRLVVPSRRFLAWSRWRSDWTRSSPQADRISRRGRLRSTWHFVRALLAEEKRRFRILLADEPVHASEYLDDAGSPFSWASLNRLFAAAHRRYRPRPLESRGWLFRAKDADDQHLHAADDTLGWRDLFTRGLEVIPLPGGHRLIEDDTGKLALSRGVNAVLAGSRTRRESELGRTPAGIVR